MSSVFLGLRGRFARGILWNVVSAASAQGSTFIANVVLARLLGKETFGTYALVLGTIQGLSMVAGLAMGYTATRYVSEFRVGDLAKAGRVLGFCLLTSGVAAATAALALVTMAPIVAKLLQDPGVVPLLRVAGVTAFFVTLNGTLMGALAGLEAYRRMAMANIGAGTIYLVVIVALSSSLGLAGVVVGLLVSAIAQASLLAIALRHEVQRQGIPIVHQGMRSERALLSRFAVPSALAGVSYAAAIWLCQMLLARTTGGYVELAQYVASFNLVTILLFLPALTNIVASSILNTMVSETRAPDYWRGFWLNVRVTALTVGSGAVLLIVAGSQILRLYGKSFATVPLVLPLLIVGGTFEALTTAAFQLMQSRERMWQGLRWVIVPRDLLLVIAAVLWVPNYGAAGLAGAYLLSRVAGLVLASLLVWMLNIEERKRQAERPIPIKS